MRRLLGSIELAGKDQAVVLGTLGFQENDRVLRTVVE